MGGKKKDKKKAEKMTWAELTGPAPDIIKVPLDWNTMLSDEEDEPAFVSIDRTNLPKAPRGPQEIPIDMIPKEPPFKAYMSGIPFTAKEENVVTFFNDCKIVNVSMGTDEGRNRGNAVVEFEDRASLINALGKNEATMGNRQVRVSLDNPRDRFMNRMSDMSRGGGPSGMNPAVSLPDDWRSQLSKRSDAPPSSRAPFAGPSGFRFNRQEESRPSYRGRFSDDSARSGFRSEGFGTWGGGGGGFKREERSSRPSQMPPPFSSRNVDRDSSQGSTQSSVPATEDSNDLVRRKIDPNALKALLTSSDDRPAPRSASIFGNAKPVDTSAKLSENSLKQLEQLKISEASKLPKGDFDGRRSNRMDRPYRSSRSEDFRANVRGQGMTFQPRPNPSAPSKDRQTSYFGQNRAAAPASGDNRRNLSGRPPPRPPRSKFEVNDFANSEDVGMESTSGAWNQQSNAGTMDVDQFGNPIASFALSTNRFESLKTEDVSGDEQED